MPSLFRSPKFILTTLVFSLIYLLSFNFLMNFSLVKLTIVGDYSLVYKFNLLWALTQGIFTAMSPLNNFLLVIVTVLTGLNLAIILNLPRKFSGKSLGVSLGTFFGMAGGSCLHCGLSVISFLGIFGSLGYLPFHGSEVSLLAIGLLSFSIWLSIRQLQRPQVCPIS